MLIPNHPSDERLSALASRDTDATADASLTAHVSTCIRCTDLVDELGALRASLAELPDLEPSRPLRLLPPVEDEPARVDRLGGWAKRFFAPVLTAGAALAMVGLVGTAAPTFPGFGQQAGASAPEDTAVLEVAQPSAESAAQGGGGEAPAAEASAAVGAAADGEEADVPLLGASDDANRASRDIASGGDELGDDDAATGLPAERSPWPMVLFTGVALMVAAALLRWILAPRAG